MVTNRRVGKNWYTPQVLGPEYASLTRTQINVTQCGGETEMSRSLSGCMLLSNDLLCSFQLGLKGSEQRPIKPALVRSTVPCNADLPPKETKN